MLLPDFRNAFMPETVLLIDDDRLIHKIIGNALKGTYALIEAYDGETGVALAREHRPDAIILDIEMPGINGYQVCEILKNDVGTRDMPIMFLSSKSGVRERMLGYELGCDDYMVKPFETEELFAKLKVLSKYRASYQTLEERFQQASQTALTAMIGNSELGLAIQYVETSYTALNYDDLAHRFLRVMASFDLSCVLLFLSAEGQMFYSSSGDPKPMETQLMLQLHSQGARFFDFGVRTQVNLGRVSLLVKNMPLNDRDRYGRLKDLLPSIMGTTDARIKAMDTERALVQQTRDLSRSFTIVQETLTELGESFRANQMEVNKVFEALWRDVDIRLPGLGLEDDQEAFLLGRIDRAMSEAHDVFEVGEELRETFSNVNRLMSHLAERQQQISEDVLTKFEQRDESAPAGDGTTDIELF